MYRTSPDVNKGLKEVFVHEQFASFYKVNQCHDDHHMSVSYYDFLHNVESLLCQILFFHINGFHLSWYFKEVIMVKSVGSCLSKVLDYFVPLQV